jgi:ABC-type transporter Mla MlaB component
VFRMDEFHTENLCVTLSLAGAFTSDYVREARSRLEHIRQQGYAVALDLSQLRQIDRDGIALLIWATRSGTQLVNAPPYILTWITQEALQNNGGTNLPEA